MTTSRATALRATGEAAAYTLSQSEPDDQNCTPQIILSALPHQLHAARILARLRSQAHDGRRSPEQDRGAAANRRMDAFGVLAELLVIAELERAGLRPEGYAFFSKHARAYCQPDFCLDGVAYDIKAVLPGKGFLCCNEAQRLRQTCHFFLPVVFCRADCALLMRPIAYEDVADWPLRTDRHSPYRSLAVARLTPSTSLREALR